MYLDLLGENDKKKKSIFQLWKIFINRWFLVGFELFGLSKWKIEIVFYCK